MKNKIKTLRNKADRLYQQIGAKENKYCMVCGGEYNCLHHYFPKSVASSLRYDLDNGINLCVNCHCRIHMSDDPTVGNIILEKKGFKWEKALQIKRRERFSATVGNYTKIIEKLQHILDKT